MAGYGAYFATRQRAREIWKDIDAGPVTGTTVLDWTGVKGMTGAFAHALAARLLESPRTAEHAGMDDDLRKTCDLACRRWERAQAEDAG